LNPTILKNYLKLNVTLMGFSIGKKERKKKKLYIASTTIMHKNFDGLVSTTTINDDKWNT